VYINGAIITDDLLVVLVVDVMCVFMTNIYKMFLVGPQDASWKIV